MKGTPRPRIWGRDRDGPSAVGVRARLFPACFPSVPRLFSVQRQYNSGKTVVFQLNNRKIDGEAAPVRLGDGLGAVGGRSLLFCVTSASLLQ